MSESAMVHSSKKLANADKARYTKKPQIVWNPLSQTFRQQSSNRNSILLQQAVGLMTNLPVGTPPIISAML
jgi:hypothetical protein